MIRWTVSPVVAPDSEPVSVAEAKAWLRIDGSDDDAQIGTLISMARSRIERSTGRLLVEQTVEFRTTGFEARLDLPRSPIVEIVAVEYLDDDGAPQSIAEEDWVAEIGDDVSYIVPAPGKSWPSIVERPGAVRVTAVCGYGAATDVPADLRHAITVIVAEAYAGREGQTTSAAAIEALISTYRVNWIG